MTYNGAINLSTVILIHFFKDVNRFSEIVVSEYSILELF